MMNKWTDNEVKMFSQMSRWQQLEKRPLQEWLTIQASKAWHQACEHDGIASDALFICFSHTNPHTGRYDDIVRFAQKLGFRINLKLDI